MAEGATLGTAYEVDAEDVMLVGIEMPGGYEVGATAAELDVEDQQYPNPD